MSFTTPWSGRRIRRRIASTSAAPRALSRIWLALVAPLLVAGVSCQESKTDPAAAASASPSASPNPSPIASRRGPSAEDLNRTTEDDTIRPVYPIDNSPPDPVAQRLCDAVHKLPTARRAECCASSPGLTPITECVRTLSYAIRSKALTLDAADVERCEQAMAKDLEGCGWVGPSPPAVPAACDGILRGQLKESALCRSSLECADGFVCQGLSATSPGACRPPRAARSACGTGIDTLATFTRQNRYEESHPECAGYCLRRVCQDTVALGDACKTGAECGPKRHCSNAKCSDAPLPEAGKPCADGACADGARCVKGVCAAPKGEGEACESDHECRGGCERSDGGTIGKCAKRCQEMPVSGPLGLPPASALIPTPAPSASPGRRPDPTSKPSKH